MSKGARIRAQHAAETVEEKKLDTTPKHMGQIGGKLSFINREQYRKTERIGIYTTKHRKHDMYYDPAATRERVKRTERGEQERVTKKKEVQSV